MLVFNKDSVLVSQQTQQLSQEAYHNFEQLTAQVLLPQDGYVTAYVGTESDVDVYFDDVRVEHRQGLQVQETQYDPAGLELAGLAAPSPGIRGLNNYRFNGKEMQFDLGLNWNHQDWRFLDPTTLHWNGVDPEVENDQESWSPYSFGFDNAVRYADANGRCPCEGDGPGDGYVPNGVNMVVNAVVGLGVSVVNTVLLAGDMGRIGGPLVATLTGTSLRATNEGGGNVSYGYRPAPTSGQQLAGYVGSDMLDAASTALTIATAGSGSLASRGLPMGAGYLLANTGGKVAQNEAVQKGKQLLATELPTLTKGSDAWKAAVKDISQGGKTASNYRTQTATQAKELMTQGRGGLTRYKQYSPAGKSARKGFEMHPNEGGSKNAPHNDLPHVKWKDWLSEHTSGDGHIFFNKPN